MADVHISDLILYNILARLPAKPLFRFKCVSKHWNCLIKDPYLMKLRSRRPMILLSNKTSLVAIDDNVDVDDTTNSVVKVSIPFGPGTTIVGTFNGIVLLLRNKHSRYELILYNPFTRVSQTYPTSVPWDGSSRYKFGLGFGATRDDLKFVRLRCSYHNQIEGCDVFSFKKNSWESIKHSIIQHTGFCYPDKGKFLNGILYWVGNVNYRYNKLVIVALSFKDMVLSTINPPDQFRYKLTPLGTIDGCLCLIDIDMKFNVWMMKEQDDENSWTKRWSFTLRLETMLFPICILDSGKILIRDPYGQLFIYCTSNASLKKLNPLKGLNARTLSKQDGIEYMESLVSPSDLCFV